MITSERHLGYHHSRVHSLLVSKKSNSCLGARMWQIFYAQCMARFNAFWAKETTKSYTGCWTTYATVPDENREHMYAFICMCVCVFFLYIF